MDITKFKANIRLAANDFVAKNPSFGCEDSKRFAAFMQAAALRECIEQGLGQGEDKVTVGLPGPEDQIEGCIALQVAVQSDVIGGGFQYFMVSVGTVVEHLSVDDESPQDE